MGMGEYQTGPERGSINWASEFVKSGVDHFRDIVNSYNAERFVQTAEARGLDTLDIGKAHTLVDEPIHEQKLKNILIVRPEVHEEGGLKAFEGLYAYATTDTYEETQFIIDKHLFGRRLVATKKSASERQQAEPDQIMFARARKSSHLVKALENFRLLRPQDSADTLLQSEAVDILAQRNELIRQQQGGRALIRRYEDTMIPWLKDYIDAQLDR